MSVSSNFFGAILDLLQGIADFFVQIGQIIFELFADIGWLTELVGNLFANPSDYIGWLPSTFVSILVLVFVLAVAFRVMGRE